MKIWQKNQSEESGDYTKLVEAFTVGKDRDFDLRMAKHDIKGSIAHATMLKKIGLLNEKEYEDIRIGLESILDQIEEGTFSIMEGAEDIHSQVEWMLTQQIGEAGKKIHSGRSRNDQVLLDIKLFLRDELLEIKKDVEVLFNLLISLADEHKRKLLPGYTHFQLAMPSSFGLWFSAYAESLSDDMEWMHAAYRACNKNPLGSGAGYGSSFPLDRELTTALLNFETMNYNVINAQMSRGKTEKAVAIGISAVAGTLSRLATDVCIYMNQQFGFVNFPEELTTGSSIMPHKKNPDVFELIRAKCNQIQALPNAFSLMMVNLPSGYHRDMQLTKELLFPALEEIRSCIRMTVLMLKEIRVQDQILEDEKYLSLFSVERVNELVLSGIPFRDAYKRVAEEFTRGEFKKPSELNHTHAGSMGNLCLDEIKENMRLQLERFN